jgi:hypothetical protein
LLEINSFISIILTIGAVEGYIQGAQGWVVPEGTRIRHAAIVMNTEDQQQEVASKPMDKSGGGG